MGERFESEIKIEQEMEPKVAGKPERMVTKFLEGKRDYFFDMYKLISKEEREEVKKYVRDSKVIASERKGELLEIAEHLDREAERKYKDDKDKLKDMTPIKREEELKKVKEEAEFHSRAAEEIDEEGLKAESWTEERISVILFSLLGEDVIKKAEQILKCIGIERMSARTLKKAKEELESKKKELQRLSPEERNKREGINSVKRYYYDRGCTKEKREEDGEIYEEEARGVERILKEIEAEEKK